MATIRINPCRVLSEVDKNIFGHFTEHAVDCIKDGIFDEDSSLSDEMGLRKDVIEAVKRVRPSQIRYPGGNFVSNYHWLDGIGPRENRKRVFEHAWKTEEDNHFGTIEFIEFCRKVNAEPYLCCNMGSGTIEEAMAWVEFCNSKGNSYYAKMRKDLGYEEPFNVKYWGLGNEVYGPWQFGGKNAEDYSKQALEFAKAMKMVDPSIILVACGNEIDQEWNTEVIKRLTGMVDYISIHHYSIAWGFPYEYQHDYMLLMTVSQLIEEESRITRATIESVTSDCRSPIKIAWDEWNLNGWFFDGVDEDSTYDLTNAIVTSSFLNAIIRNSDIIGMANYSPFVNLSGALKVNANGVKYRPQYYVFDLYSNHTGSKLVDTIVNSETFEYGMPLDARLSKTHYFTITPSKSVMRVLPYVDAVSTFDADSKKLYVSVVNKNPDKAYPVEISIDEFNVADGGAKLYQIYAGKLTAHNSTEYPEAVRIVEQSLQSEANAVSVRLPEHSINVIEIQLL